MSSAISWNLQMTVNDGQLDHLKALMAEMVENTKTNEPGAMIYEGYMNEDETKFHFIEKYTDAGAVLVHLGNFGEKYAERFMTYLTIDSFTVYGPVTDEIKGALAPFGTVFYHGVVGFTR